MRNDDSHLIKVGYWRERFSANWHREQDPDNPDYAVAFPGLELPIPTPTKWVGHVKDMVVAHLKAGETIHRWKGWSNCRICGCVNGTVCVTDGVWVWPVGLAHYVEEHNVGLPAEFVLHIDRMSQ
jgi:hypothetical protein